MTTVLVVEFDDQLRGILYDILTADGRYDVVEVATEADGIAVLAAHREGMVVVVSNQHPDHHWTAAVFAQVVANADLATRNQYILLSSNPPSIPQDLQTCLDELCAPILPKPFHLEAFLTAVNDATERLAASHRRDVAQSA